MILPSEHPVCASCESAYSVERSANADPGTNQAALDANKSGYDVSVRNIQLSRAANLRAAATLATAPPRPQNSYFASFQFCPTPWSTWMGTFIE